MSYKPSTVTPEYVTVFYDTADPKNAGWAYNVIIEGEHTSGPLDARRRDAKLPGLLRLLRAEFRNSGVNLPDEDAFRAVRCSMGWEAYGWEATTA